MERAYRHAQRAANEGEYEVVIRKATKSRQQEEHYHALIGDIAKQYQHAGRTWDDEDMKRILVDAFKHETKRSEERRVGKECVSTCSSRWSPYHSKKKKNERTHKTTLKKKY